MRNKSIERGCKRKENVLVESEIEASTTVVDAGAEGGSEDSR